MRNCLHVAVPWFSPLAQVELRGALAQWALGRELIRHVRGRGHHDAQGLGDEWLRAAEPLLLAAAAAGFRGATGAELQDDDG